MSFFPIGSPPLLPQFDLQPGLLGLCTQDILWKKRERFLFKWAGAQQVRELRNEYI